MAVVSTDEWRIRTWTSRIRGIAQAALGKHVSPHYLRHGFATALVGVCADIRFVSWFVSNPAIPS